jgi:hypothetical protein
MQYPGPACQPAVCRASPLHSHSEEIPPGVGSLQSSFTYKPQFPVSRGENKQGSQMVCWHLPAFRYIFKKEIEKDKIKELLNMVYNLFLLFARYYVFGLYKAIRTESQMRLVLTGVPTLSPMILYEISYINLPRTGSPKNL